MPDRYVTDGYYGGYPLSLDQEPDEEPTPCELCPNEATEKVDIDPLRNPGRYMADLCAKCADFERARINREIKDEKLFKLKHNG